MSSPRSSDRVSPIKAAARPNADQIAVARLAGLFRAEQASPVSHAMQLIDGEGQRLSVPRSLVEVIVRAADLIATGRRVTVIADDEMLTTQEAADRLNVSRQYVVRLIDRGDLPAVRVGSHRRLRPDDVSTFRANRDKSRDAALDRLSTISEELGGYTLSR